jgi:4-methyl-5(b-hydroxyethyl)-thiazole monophosphate biosynthesis
MTRALVPLTDGVEEMEAVIAIDVLRRAGWDVVAVGMKSGLVTASRRVSIQPDKSWDQIDPASFDIIVIPGGKGAETLARDARLLAAIREFHAAGKWLAAICAAPIVLQAAGVLKDRNFTCFPSTAREITTGRRLDDKVVVDGHVITSQGPGTSFDFALTLIRLIDGDDAADRVAAQMIWRYAAKGRKAPARRRIP